MTSPSAGASGPGADRIALCVNWLRDQGYDVIVGECMDRSGITSASADRRAAELTAMLCAPDIRCVLHGGGSVIATGRLIGGCIETVANLAGTRYGDVAAFGDRHANDGLIVYLEAAEDEAATSAATSTASGRPVGSSTPTRSSSAAQTPSTTRTDVGHRAAFKESPAAGRHPLQEDHAGRNR